MAEEGFITMVHPEIGGVADVTPQAFEDHWKQRGWKRMDEGGDSLSKARLEAIAAERGVDTSDAKTKADIVAELKKEA